MGRIYIGTFAASSPNYGRFDCYLDYDSIYRNGNSIVLNRPRIQMDSSGSAGYSTNRIAAMAGYNGSTNNLLNNFTINPSSNPTASAYTIQLASSLSISTNGDFPIYIAIASTGYTSTWSNFQAGSPIALNTAIDAPDPEAPSIPASISIPSSIAPDKIANLNWNASSGGTNGVKGYILAWSKDGGTNYTEMDVGNVTSYNINLNSLGFIQGSILKSRVRSYTSVNGVRYYSAWATSSQTTTAFVAPGTPKTLTLNTNPAGQETIANKTYRGTFAIPDNTGTNGISGYCIQWLKNGVNYGDEIDLGNVLQNDITLNENDFQPGDTISFKVKAYTIGQETKYYGNYVTSSVITIVSDKYIFISENGGSFTKYKMFISVNGGDFSEVKKEKFVTIV